MSSADPYHIDDYVPFRDSKLWALQRNYFNSKGVHAWGGEIPFYISSNAFIAKQYAELVHAFIQDTLKIHPELQNETFYIAELGSGMGRFSFYFLKAFFKMQDPQASFKINYIMTDVVEKNKLFWEQNEYFQSLVNKGLLEFALWDIEEQTYNVLTSPKTPLIVIANYIFDCTKQDILQVNQQKLYEVQVEIKSRYKNYDQSKAEYLKELKFEYQTEPHKAYHDPVLNNLLDIYSQLPEGSTFTVPLGALSFLNYLEKHTDNRYFILAGDKGIANINRWIDLRHEDMFSYEGCYAFMVNFDILGRYLKAMGGDSLLTHRTTAFKICLYSSNMSFSQLKETSALYQQHFEQFSADEFCYLNEAIQNTCDHYSLKGLISHLRLSHWDMNAYDTIHDRLLDLVAPIKVDLDSDLMVDMQQVEDHIYYHPGMNNTYNQLGNFYQIINQPQKAIELYQKALKIWGECIEPHHNLGMIYEQMDNVQQAIHHYKQSILFNTSKNAHSQYAKRRIQVLTGNPLRDLGGILMRTLLVFSIIALVFYYLVFVL